MAIPSKLLRAIEVVFSLAVFSIASSIIYRHVKKFGLDQIWKELHSFSWGQLVLAGFLTVACHVMLTGYDFFAFRYLNLSLPYRKLAPRSLIAYIFGNN